MARLSLECSIRIMSSAGYDVDRFNGGYVFDYPRFNMKKCFMNGREVVSYVRACGSTVQGVMDARKAEFESKQDLDRYDPKHQIPDLTNYWEVMFS